MFEVTLKNKAESYFRFFIHFYREKVWDNFEIEILSDEYFDFSLHSDNDNFSLSDAEVIEQIFNEDKESILSILPKETLKMEEGDIEILGKAIVTFSEDYFGETDIENLEAEIINFNIIGN